jgi:hypothetical protein
MASYQDGAVVWPCGRVLRFIVAIVVFAAIVVITFPTLIKEFTGDIGLGQVVRGRVCLGRFLLNVLER